MRRLVLLLVAVLLPATPSAQRPADAPETKAAGKAPDSVFIEDLTWAEVRDAIKAGTTTVIIGTAGTEQKGPHMVDGEHKFVMEYAADKIARAIGKTLVAPVITYVPEGSWENPGGHMGKPGTITLPEDRFVELLVNAGRSLKSGGFTTIIFLGESGGNRNGMRAAATRLNELFKGEARAMWLDDYYTKSHSDQNAYITKTMGIPANEIGGHANLLDTSELLFVNPKHIRKNKIAPGGGYQNSGVSGDPTKSSAELGKTFIQIKIDNTLAQYKAVQAGEQPLVAEPAQRGQGQGGRGGRAGGRGAEPGRGGDAAAGRGGDPAASVQPPLPSAPAPPRPPTMDTAPAGISPTAPPDTVFIDELTWEETRDLMKAGWRTAIIPTGGTEKNGYHMTLGKHNVIVTHSANLMARKLTKTLVAPTIQYVPEGNPDRAGPGVISHPSPAYDQLLDAAARSLKAHGFREIIFIGDSGGNQMGLRNVAAALNKEWAGQDVKVFALTDYYEQGRVDYREWMLKTHKFDDTLVGSHAGISDTSQLLHVAPSHVRKDQIMPWGGPRDSGVSGDPTKATAEIGRMGINFKIDAAIRQMQTLKKS
jgi:creatinine amidohydrolase/Fe(II)-dependent formamide hydrolase-like protein